MNRFPGKYVFVAGLHRSGTSLVADILGSHPEVSQITGAPIPEQEGVYLQGAIPHTARHGIPGEFAFDPAQHMIEGHPLDSLQTRKRMEADWAPWFTPGGKWRVEKSPVNLLRMRLYQQLFPLAHFVLVVRHPRAVALSTAKWSPKSISQLVRHWEHAYGIATKDLEFLHHAFVLRYEDLCHIPSKTVENLFAFLSLQSADCEKKISIQNRNPNGLTDCPSGSVASRFGYQSSPRDNCEADLLKVRHSLRSVREFAVQA